MAVMRERSSTKAKGTVQAMRAIALLAVVLLGAFLRLRNLDVVPGWYPDEGSNIAIAASLAQGESAYLAFGHSSFVNGHTPLVYLEMAVLFRLFGVDILWARLLMVVLALLTLLILYAVVYHMSGWPTALLAAAFYALYPSAVVYNRLAFTYNQLALCYLLTLYSLWRVAEGKGNRWVVLAALCVGVAWLTDMTAVALFLFLFLGLLFTRPRTLLWGIPLALLPLLGWGLIMFLAAGEFFLQDVVFFFSRTDASLPVQVVQIIFYRLTLEGDLWLALGGLGLLFQTDHRRRWLAFGLFGLSLLLFVRNGPVFGQAFYFLIPLFPLAAWGLGMLLVRGVPVLVNLLDEAFRSGLAFLRCPVRLRARLATWLTALLLFLFLLAPPISMVAEGIWLDYDLYLARLGATLADPDAARDAVDYVNAHTNPDDVVLASPTIAWLLHAQAADFQMAVAATGQATAHFPADIPLDRFRFDPQLENASYVVIDPLWRGWASAQMPQVKTMVRQIEEEWTLEACYGEFEVYSPPHVGGNG